MATDFDPYRILQIPLEASDEDVRAAYGRMSGIVRDGEMSEETARAVDAAYRILSDAEQRRAYDQRRTEAIARGYVMPKEGAEEMLHPQRARVPWGFKDLALALILPMLFVILNVTAGILSGGADEPEGTEEFIFVFGFSILVEGALLFLAYFFSVRKYRLNWSALGLRKPEGIRWWFPLALWGGAYAVVFAYLAALYFVGIGSGSSNVPESAYDEPVAIALLALLSVAVAPIVEEIFFRGFLFQGLNARWPLWMAITVSAAIFGSVHLGTPDSFLVFIPISTIGGIFAWSTWRTGSVIPSMIAHFLFNLTSLAIGAISTW